MAAASAAALATNWKLHKKTKIKTKCVNYSNTQDWAGKYCTKVHKSPLALWETLPLRW